MQSPESNKMTSNEAVTDVGAEQLARIYAKAFLAATESSDQTALVEELDSLVSDVLDKHSEFDFYLTSETLSHEEREDLIEKVLGGRASGPVLNLLKVLSQNHRQSSLRNVVHAVHKLYNEMQGRHEVRVYAPHPMSIAQQSGLREALRARLGVDSEFHFHQRPELIGGLIVQVGDTVFDGSVRSTLERARQRMLDQAVEAIETRPEIFYADKPAT